MSDFISAIFRWPVSVDRVAGMLRGLALGDALGAPHEFSRGFVYSGVVEHNATYRNQFQGTRRLGVGGVTDDTMLTLALAHSLLHEEGYQRTDVLHAYMRWASSKGSHAIGFNTRALIKGVRTIKGYEKRFAAHFSDQEKRDAVQSNGALMRCAPLACLPDLSYTREDCYLTNPNELSAEVSSLQVVILRSALVDLSPAIIWHEINPAVLVTNYQRSSYRCTSYLQGREQRRLAG